MMNEVAEVLIVKELAKLFGGLLADGVGLLGDRLKFYRMENVITLEENLKAKLKKKGITLTKPLHPKIGLPLIEYASMEDNPTLQEKWANLLANAIDNNNLKEIKRSYISILAELEVIDVAILDVYFHEHKNQNNAYTRLYGMSPDLVKRSLGDHLVNRDIKVSLLNLERLGLIYLPAGEDNTLSNRGYWVVHISHLGLDFLEAVS